MSFTKIRGLQMAVFAGCKRSVVLSLHVPSQNPVPGKLKCSLDGKLETQTKLSTITRG
ncbi:hypothetical protein Mapa_014988 [Marchantia paleacea]|nr:hypothetical protein Mapa_014988 [Marchantia paleacea]